MTLFLRQEFIVVKRAEHSGDTRSHKRVRSGRHVRCRLFYWMSAPGISNVLHGQQRSRWRHKSRHEQRARYYEKTSSDLMKMAEQAKFRVRSWEASLQVQVDRPPGCTRNAKLEFTSRRMTGQYDSQPN